MFGEQSHVVQDNCCQEFLGKKRQNLFQFSTKKEKKSDVKKMGILVVLMGVRMKKCEGSN